MFDIAVTLKYGQGHWKCYEQVKLYEYTITQSLTLITFMLSEKISMLVSKKFEKISLLKVSEKPRHLTNEMHVILSPLNRHQNYTTHIAHNLFNLCSNRTMFKLQRTNIPKTRYLHFIFLTHLWPWNKVKVIKSTMTM